MKNIIVDIHSHMMYGIDDGSRDFEMTMKLIDMDYQQGVRYIFLTSHNYGLEHYANEYQENFEYLNNEVHKKYNDLFIYKGSEIYCYIENLKDIISYLNDGTYPTLNNTKYVLIEFNHEDIVNVKQMIYCVKYILNNGYIPVLAHIERYGDIYSDAIKNIEYLKKLGCMTQINLYSIEQDRGLKTNGKRKELANLFLDHHLVDFVGTDTHRLDYKSPEALIGANKIIEKYDREYAESILYKNAKKYLNI